MTQATTNVNRRVFTLAERTIAAHAATEAAQKAYNASAVTRRASRRRLGESLIRSAR